jgi:hypothetical protein
MYHGAKGAALIALLTFTGVTAQAAESTNGSNLNGSNGANLNGAASGRVFLGSHVSSLVTPNGAIITLD